MKKLILPHFIFPVYFIMSYIFFMVYMDSNEWIKINYSPVLAIGGVLSVVYIIIRFITWLFMENNGFGTISSLALTFVLVSRVFRIMHWPLSSLMLYTGLFFLIITGILYILIYLRKNS